MERARTQPTERGLVSAKLEMARTVDQVPAAAPDIGKRRCVLRILENGEGVDQVVAFPQGKGSPRGEIGNGANG